MLLRLADQAFFVLQVLALCSSVIVLLVAKPVQRWLNDVRAEAHAVGASRVVATSAFFGLLGLLLLAAALERRIEGPSPLLTLPIAGRVLRLLENPARLRLLILVVGVAALFLVLALVLQVRREPRKRGLRAAPLWVGWLFWLCAVTLAGPGAVGREAGLTFVASVIALLACLLLLRAIAPRCAEGLLWVLVLSVISLNYFSWLTSPGWAVTSTWTGGFLTGGRLRGIFPQPNVAGLLFAVLLLFVVSQRHASRALRLGASALLAGLLIATGSRGAVLVMLVGAALLHVKQPRRRVLQLGVAVVLFSAAVPLLDLAAFVNGRDSTWALALNLARQRPLTGGGAFPVTGPDGGLTEAVAPLYAHNQLLQSLAETGAVGTLLLLAALSASLWYVPARSAGWATAAAGAVVATFAFENPVRVFQPAFLLLLAIFLLALATLDLDLNQDRGRRVARRGSKRAPARAAPAAGGHD